MNRHRCDKLEAAEKKIIEQIVFAFFFYFVLQLPTIPSALAKDRYPNK